MHTLPLERPWYREFWVWFILALPTSAVIAGISTVFIASGGSDALVVDDFQKVGLVARRESARDREAERLHIGAAISIDRNTGAVVLRLAGEVQAERVQLGLFHPTRSDLDRTALLQRDGDDIYRGSFGAAVAGHWYVQLADPVGAWRVSGRLADDGNLVRLGAIE